MTVTDKQIIAEQQKTIKKLVDTLNLFLHSKPNAEQAAREIVTEWMMKHG